MPILKNPKHEIFAQEYAKGKTAVESAILAGYSHKAARARGCNLSAKPEIAKRVYEINAKIAELSEWNSAKVLNRLGELVEIQAKDFEKPRSEWTPAMERWACDQENISERSQDGVQAGEAKSWDVVGVRVKIPASVKVKALELIGRHTAVDSWVKQQQAQELHIHLHAERHSRLVRARELAAGVTHEISEISETSET